MKYDCAIPFQMLLAGQKYSGLGVPLLSVGSSQPSMTRWNNMTDHQQN